MIANGIIAIDHCFCRLQADLPLDRAKTAPVEEQVTRIQNQEIRMSSLMLLNRSGFLGQTAKPVSSSPTGFGFALNRSRKDDREFFCQDGSQGQQPES